MQRHFLSQIHKEIHPQADSLEYYKTPSNLCFKQRKEKAMQIIGEIKTIRTYPHWQHNRWVYRNVMKRLNDELLELVNIDFRLNID